jgi:hypothetical protein
MNISQLSVANRFSKCSDRSWKRSLVKTNSLRSGSDLSNKLCCSRFSSKVKTFFLVYHILESGSYIHHLLLNGTSDGSITCLSLIYLHPPLQTEIRGDFNVNAKIFSFFKRKNSTMFLSIGFLSKSRIPSDNSVMLIRWIFSSHAMIGKLEDAK